MSNTNLNDWRHDYNEWWAATHKEMLAKGEKMNAEERMKYNDAVKNYSEEFDAAGDWLEADYEQFKARVSKWWNEQEMKTNQ